MSFKNLKLILLISFLSAPTFYFPSISHAQSDFFSPMNQQMRANRQEASEGIWGWAGSVQDEVTRLNMEERQLRLENGLRKKNELFNSLSKKEFGTKVTTEGERELIHQQLIRLPQIPNN